MKNKTVAIYARFSTGQQKADMHIREIQNFVSISDVAGCPSKSSPKMRNRVADAVPAFRKNHGPLREFEKADTLINVAVVAAPHGRLLGSAFNREWLCKSKI